MSVNIRLYVDLCDLAAPVLGWQEWDALAGETRTKLELLAKEAQQRYLGPVLEAMANAPTWANLPSPETQSSGTDDMAADGMPG